MSEVVPYGIADFYGKTREAGQEYWTVRKRLEELKEVRLPEQTPEVIRELETQLKRFGEGTMRSRIEEQIDRLKSHDKEVGSARKRLSDLVVELLQLTVDFFEIDPKGEQKLDRDYIRALNQIFLGDPKDKMEFHECVISPEGLTTIDDEIRAIVICANICDFVRMAASRRMAENTGTRDESGLEKLWDHVYKAKNMFTVYSMVASEAKTLSPAMISAKLSDSEWDPMRVKNCLNDLLRDRLFTHKLLMRVERGKFKVSDIGRMVWKEFAPREEKTTKLQPSPQSPLNKWTTQTVV